MLLLKIILGILFRLVVGRMSLIASGSIKLNRRLMVLLIVTKHV
jgi:hypothetical protein